MGFTDDIILISSEKIELKIMLQKLYKLSNRVSLQMNQNHGIVIDNHNIENVEHYICLENDPKLGKKMK